MTSLASHVETVKSTLPIIALFLPAAFLAQDFAGKVYPILEKAQCRACHNDNGVASATRVQFPREGASVDEIAAFGLRLRVVVQAGQPGASLLLLKPTNRVAHAGGERIKRDSEDEKVLRAWVEHLAALPVADVDPTAPRAGKPRLALRRLTHSQYNHTVRDLLGDGTRPADQFPKEDFVHGFTNQSEGQAVSPLLAEAYARAAERLARAAFRGGDSHGIVPCKPEVESCGAEFIRAFGRKAFRRPLDDLEVRRYEELFAKEKTFLSGAQMVVEAMLQSPHFLFHLAPGAYGVAGRLSYFLWDTLPDEELFQAAKRGDLDTTTGVEKQIQRMLQDPRAQDALDEFLAQWMRFDRLRNAIRDRRLFPEFTSELVAGMIEETRRLFRSLVWEDRDFREYFTASYAYLSPEIAKLYGVPAPSEPWKRVEFASDSERAGVLGQATFLALTSKPVETSPTERGLFVREHFLCQVVPPPPAGVNTTLPPVTDEKPTTTRERLQIHLSDATCAGCHKLVDPVGFGFERFDAIGKQREKQLVTIFPTVDETASKRKVQPTEYKLDIKAEGDVLGLKDAKFTSPRQLGEILAREPGCQRCVVKMLFRWANGRPEEPDDQPLIETALDRFRQSGFKFRQLVVATAASLSRTDSAGARQQSAENFQLRVGADLRAPTRLETKLPLSSPGGRLPH